MIDDSGSMRTNDPQFRNPAGGLRNQGAKNLVDVLATQYYLPAVQAKADNPDVRLPNVQVAVIHFSEGLKEYSKDWITINPGTSDEWLKQQAELYKLIDWKNNYSTKQFTHFIEPFTEAANLFTSSAAQAQGADCIRRSIMVFTDGTPENQGGILRGSQLKDEMDKVNAIVQDKLSGSEVKTYVTAFKVDSHYWRDVATYWDQIVGTTAQSEDPQGSVLLEGEDSLIQMATRMEKITASLANIQSFALNPDEQNSRVFTVAVPNHVQSLRLTLYSLDPENDLSITAPNGDALVPDDVNVFRTGETSSVEAWRLVDPAAGSYKIETSKRGGSITGLLTYQTLAVEFASEPNRLTESQPSDLKFKLMDGAGNLVLPGDDSSYTLDLKVYVTQGTKEDALKWSQDGDGYTVSWTPPSAGDGNFRVEANLVGADGKALWNCEGAVATLPVDPLPQPQNPPTLVITAPSACVPANTTTAIPVHVKYDGDMAWTSTIKWDVRAQTTPGGQKVDAIINTVNAANGEYELRVQPGAAVDIQVTVRANAEMNGQPITIDGQPFTIKGCQCDCDALWKFWFWPLALVLLGLLILLLVLRFRPQQDGKETPKENQDRFKTGFWHLLFWPVLILLILLILNRWLWCCIIPLWLFLALILLILILLLMTWFLSEDEAARRRFWWLIGLLLILIVIWYLLFRTQWIYLLWLLLLLFFLIWIILWIRRRKEPVSPWWLIILLTFLLAIWIIVFGGLTFWLILLWLLLWLVILLIGWVISIDIDWRGSLRFWILVILGIAAAVAWYVYFSDYRIHLFWTLLLIFILFWFISRPPKEREVNLPWWLIILLTLIISIWITLFGRFPFWLILILLLMWLAILFLVWIFTRDTERRKTSQPWYALGFLVILLLASFIYYSAYWMYLLLWLLLLLIVIWLILWLLPEEPPYVPPHEPIVPPPPRSDDLTLIEGIGPKVQKFLNQKGITTFEQVANLQNIDELDAELSKRGWEYMNPKTWPEQARLANIASASGRKEDWKDFQDFVDHLKAGLPPEEWKGHKKSTDNK